MDKIDWIECKDRLPSELEEVLIFVHIGGYERYYDVSFVEDGKWVIDECEYGIGLTQDKVIKWSILPDYPECDDEEL